MKRRIAATLALALCVLGCSIFQPPVKLLTYTELAVWACCDPLIGGQLLPDPDVGTVLRVEEDGRLEPITWPAGYTGRLAGSEVEILNERGEVVARTGQKYVCRQSANTPAFWYGCEELPVGPEPTPAFDLAAVKAEFEQECENPTVLEDETCRPDQHRCHAGQGGQPVCANDVAQDERSAWPAHL